MPRRTLRVGAGQDLAAAAVAQQVLRQFGHHDGDAAGVGFVVAEPRGQAADPPAGVGDIGRVADGDGFHGATSNARW